MMTPEKATKYRAWLAEVAKCEGEVLQTVATPCGGRKQKETIEEYAARVNKIQLDALARLAIARAELKKASP